MYRSALMLSLMIAAVIMAIIMRPTQKIAEIGTKLALESMIPRAFGEWQEDTHKVAQVIDPLQSEMLKKLYSQTLSRSYVDGKGNRIMLSIAYGEDQRDNMQIHYPEVCYPAQGLRIVSNRVGHIDTAQGSILVRRLEAEMGGQRYEPLTYWIMIGSEVVIEGTGKKVAELKYGLRGDIPDGMVFRVSSINRNTEEAFLNQNKFVSDLIFTLQPDARRRLAGLQPEKSQDRHNLFNWLKAPFSALDNDDLNDLPLVFIQGQYKVKASFLGMR